MKYDEIRSNKEVLTGVYIIHFEDGRMYVGQSVDIYARIRGHVGARKNTTSYVDRAIKKYGCSSIEVTIASLCEPHELPTVEKHWAETLDTYAPNGFNVAECGQYGYRRRFMDPEAIASIYMKVSIANKGKKRSEETKRRLREACKTRVQPERGEYSDEHRKAISEGRRSGKAAPKRGAYSEEHKRKISEGIRKAKEERATRQ